MYQTRNMIYIFYDVRYCVININTLLLIHYESVYDLDAPTLLVGVIKCYS